MKDLRDIILMKAKELGGNANLARKLNWGKSEKNPGAIIGQYIEKGKAPSIEFAIKWKEAFNENLIELMFADERPPIVAEPEAKYHALEKRIIELENKLNKQK